RLDEPLARRPHLVGQLGRRRALLHDARIALIHVGAASEQVDDATELPFTPDWQLEERRLGADRSEVLERVLDVGALAVEPGDEGDGGDPELAEPPPELLGLDLHLATPRPEDADHARGRVQAI